VLQAQRVRLVELDPRVPQVLPEPLEPQALQELQERQEPRVSQVLQELQVQPVLQVPLVQEQRVLPEQRVPQV
jgi:hypothetical protein